MANNYNKRKAMSLCLSLVLQLVVLLQGIDDVVAQDTDSGPVKSPLTTTSYALSKISGGNLNLAVDFTKLFDFFNPSRWIDPDEKRTLAELVASRGFLLQSHTVQSEDGYLTTLHRVVPGNYSLYANYSKTRKPLIAWHGITCRSDTFLFNSPNLEAEDNPNGCGDTFGFCAVQTGRYDLWLANARGNDYSTGHVSLSTEYSFKYWNFSFEEMSLYDLPAIVDYVRAQTGRKMVSFLGHSQGASVVLGTLSLKPNYAHYIRPVVTWAPAPFIGNFSSPMLRMLLPMQPILHRIPAKFLLTYQWVSTLLQAICVPLSNPICKPMASYMFGTSEHLNASRIPTYLKSLSSGVSNKEMLHLIQLITANDFVRFDFGSEEANQIAYGQPKPPRFPLESIPNGFPFQVFHGSTDKLVMSSDVDVLVQRLTEAGLNVTRTKVGAKNWNHMDFVAGLSAGRLLNDPTIAYLDQYYDQ